MKKNKIFGKLTLVFCLCLCLVFGLMGCERSGGIDDATTQDRASQTTEAEGTESRYDSVTLDGMANDILKTMTLEEKIGQMFIVYTDDLDYNAETKVTKKMKEALTKYQPGGILYFSFNLSDREQTIQFLKDSNSYTRIPLFLAVDEEGGDVARIANNKKMGTTSFPNMSEIGETGDINKAYEVGNTIGKEIAELGFNLDFAPVADLSINDDNTEIGERSFGHDPSMVGKMVAQVIKGLQDNGVSAAVKHFPGQGDLGDDTHKGYVSLERNINELRAEEFLPFKAGIKAGVDMVMMSHEAVEKVTQTSVPASLSSLLVSDILRDELHFNQIVVTDAMNMKIITKFYESDEAALKAVEAGVDIILMPDDFPLAYEGLYRAVADGKISQKRIDESVKRILKVKLQRGIMSFDEKQ